jgi:thiamine-monophosphate kinase
LNICITVFGELAPGQALRRSAAVAGDDIWVSGTLGDARLALAGYRMEQELSPADLLTAAARIHAHAARGAGLRAGGTGPGACGHRHLGRPGGDLATS